MEKNKSKEGEEADKQEPYYGSTVIVWIRPKPGKYCELKICIGDANRSIMIPSSLFQDLMSVISMVTEKNEDAHKICKPDE